MATPEQEALAGMAKVGAPREPMGQKPVSFTAPKPEKGTLVKKGSSAASDPAVQNQGTRSNRPYSGQERLGAAYGVKASYAKQTAPEAGMTQANGRIVSPAVIRQKDSWSEGLDTSY
jgi:hypothetical protein